MFKQDTGFIHTTASKFRKEGVEIPHSMFLVVGNISTSVTSDSSQPVQDEEDHMWLPLQQKHIRGTSSRHRTWTCAQLIRNYADFPWFSNSMIKSTTLGGCCSSTPSLSLTHTHTNTHARTHSENTKGFLSKYRCFTVSFLGCSETESTRYVGHYLAYCISPGWWVWSSRWNDSLTATCTHMGSNMCRRGGKPAINRLS
jgi:hypothetical protein